MGLVGFGDIGKATAKRALATEMKVIAYDPAYKPAPELSAVEAAQWPNRVVECDFIVFTCSLTPTNRHMLNLNVVRSAKKGVRIVNVARGPLISEAALIAGLEGGIVHSAALDVFEDEPLPMSSPLRKYEKCVFGSHNGSNTTDAVMKTSERAMQLLFGFLGIT
jgi:D-3-phosphoglycerate dehydrogenase